MLHREDVKTKKIYICERFKGAFNLRYSNKKGSIYVLTDDSFIEGKTERDEEIVSPIPVISIEEIKINDIKEYLLNLEKQDRLIIKYYPDKIDSIPIDDEDLVERGIVWTRKFGDKILHQIEQFHPQLIERVIKGLKENKYL